MRTLRPDMAAAVNTAVRKLSFVTTCEQENVELNFPGDPRHEAYAEDAFKYLDRMGDQYDLIILDPPAFAKHKDALRNALQGYRKLNAKAFEKIKPGGILFTFLLVRSIALAELSTE